MSIDTMEKLLAVPEGEAVIAEADTTRKKVWVRTSEGFSFDGVVVKPEFFEGAVSAGVIVPMHEAPIQPGDYFDNAAYREHRIGEVIVSVDPDDNGKWLCAETQYGAFRRLSSRFDVDLKNPALYRRYAAKPEWVPTAQSFGDQLYAQRRSIVALETEVNTRVQRVEQLRAELRDHSGFPDGFVTGFHELLDQFDDNDDRVRVNEYLGRFNVGLMENHVMGVTITGTSYLTPSMDQARNLIGGTDITIEDVEDSSTVHWTKSVTIEREAVGCVCDDLARETDIDPHLPTIYDAETVDWTVDH